MNDRGDPGEQILPRAGKQRFTSRHAAQARDPAPIADLDVVGPAIGVRVGRAAEPSIMVAMQMVVRVDQPGPDIGVAAIEDRVVSPALGDDPPAFDRDRAVASVDEQSHRSALPPERQGQDDRETDMQFMVGSTARALVDRAHIVADDGVPRDDESQAGRARRRDVLLGPMNVMLDLNDLVAGAEAAAVAGVPRGRMEIATMIVAPMSATRASSA